MKYISWRYTRQLVSLGVQIKIRGVTGFLLKISWFDITLIRRNKINHIIWTDKEISFPRPVYGNNRIIYLSRKHSTVLIFDNVWADEAWNKHVNKNSLVFWLDTMVTSECWMVHVCKWDACEVRHVVGLWCQEEAL